MAVTIQQEVAALYSAIFSRAPDQDGLDFWVNAIEGGDSLVTAAEGFTLHPVFAETYASMTDSEFVQALYQNILGGAGDAGGIQFWTDKLASGVSQGQVVAEFVQGALSIDLDSLLASGELSQADYDAAVLRQDSLTNKANVGLEFVAKFGAASNLSADTDTTTKAGLEADPVYLASQAAIANVTADPASLEAALAAIEGAASPAELNEPQAPAALTLTEALALEELPEGYSLSDATVDFGALEVAAVAAQQEAAAAVVAGAANAAELTLEATYTLADTLANIAAADAAVVEGAASYALTDEATDLGTVSAELKAIIDAASNAAAYTYDLSFTLTAGLADIEAANQEVEDFLAGLELEWNYNGDGIAQNIVKAGDATEANVNSDLADAVAVYDAAVDAASSSVDGTEINSEYATQSAGVRSAILADAQVEVAEALATAEENLADRDAAIAKVAGLTEALAASAAADKALQTAKDEVVARYETGASYTVAETTAIASLIANLNALADVSGTAVAAVSAAGEYGEVVNSDSVSVTPKIADSISLTSTKLGAITLASYDADANRLVLTTAADELAADATTEQKALFAEYQALAATVISQANAAYVAHENLTALDEAAVNAARELSYVDADAAVTAALNALAAADVFTLTEFAGAKPTLTEVKAEIAALQTAVAEAAQLSNDADAAESTAVATANTALGADFVLAASVDPGEAFTVENTTEALQATLNADGTVTYAGVNTLSDAQKTALESLADLAFAAINAATAQTNAETALSDFTALVYADLNPVTTTLFEALDANKLAVVNGDSNTPADDYSALESAIVEVQAKIDNLNAAIADLAEAEGNREELTALQKAVTDAEKVVVAESGFDVLNNVDSASEFGTAKNDLFLAGTVNSTIYSASLQGDDALFVGTNVTYNAAVIGADEGEVALAKAGNVSALEFFLEETASGVNVYIETKAYGSETGDYTTITLSGQTLADITVDGGLLTIA